MSHRPEWIDDVPTGWCECGKAYPHDGVTPYTAIDAFLASPQAAEELARALEPHQTEAGPFSALVDEDDRWHYHLASPSEFASVLLTAWQKLRHPEDG